MCETFRGGFAHGAPDTGERGGGAPAAHARDKISHRNSKELSPDARDRKKPDTRADTHRDSVHVLATWTGGAGRDGNHRESGLPVITRAGVAVASAGRERSPQGGRNIGVPGAAVFCFWICDMAT